MLEDSSTRYSQKKKEKKKKAGKKELVKSISIFLKIKVKNCNNLVANNMKNYPKMKSKG